MPRIRALILPAMLLVAPRLVLAQATVTLLDTLGPVGYNPSVAIGGDGLGLIAYHDVQNGALKVAHCQDSACTSATLSTIDNTGVGRVSALAMGADGRGIISYYDDSPAALKAAHCNDVACTSATITVVEAANVLGQTSLAIGSDGLPLIVYVRGNDVEAHLVSAHCSDAACTAATVSALRTVSGIQNMDTAVAIGTDGLGLIAYPVQAATPGPGGIIWIAHCVDTACTAVTPPAPGSAEAEAPQAGVTFLRRPSLLIGADGRGLVSYRRDFIGLPSIVTYEIVVQHCASTTCESFDATRLIPIASNDGPNAPLAVGASGLPLLVRAQNQKLRFAQCADAACSTSTDTCVLIHGQDTALARGTDAVPLVAFLAVPGQDLGVVHGSDVCAPSVAGVQDLDIDEGNGPMSWGIQVTLDTPPDQTATVHLETADVTAQAGSDYTAVSATLTFQPGQASQGIWVPILGDTTHEPDEAFELVLSDPQGLVIGDGVGVVTLRNDDGLPTVDLDGCTVTEGNAGTVGCVVQARLSEASSFPITVDYTTADGTAQAGVDYIAAAGTLSFAPGTTAQTVSVSVVGDVTVELDETFFVDLSNPVNVVVGDGHGEGSIVDDDAASLSSLELTHGSRVGADLAATPGPIADQDLYRLAQGPYSSWEVVVDEVSGDVAPGLVLERLAEDNSTILQTGAPIGTGSARALRWQRRAATQEVRQHLRVRSTSCTTDCGADDTYRLRAVETTGRIPRFNNSGSQVTVLILQNPTGQPIDATADFWDASGARLASVAVAAGAHAVGVVSTPGIPGLAGVSGSLTVTNDAPYGVLTGKAVALEPATGFSFDSPLEYRPR